MLDFAAVLTRLSLPERVRAPQPALEGKQPTLPSHTNDLPTEGIEKKRSLGRLIRLNLQLVSIRIPHQLTSPTKERTLQVKGVKVNGRRRLVLELGLCLLSSGFVRRHALSVPPHNVHKEDVPADWRSLWWIRLLTGRSP